MLIPRFGTEINYGEIHQQETLQGLSLSDRRDIAAEGVKGNHPNWDLMRAKEKLSGYFLDDF